MEIPNSELWRACSEDPGRYVLGLVHFNREKMRLEASDGKMLATVPVDPETVTAEDTGSWATVDALKAAVRQGGSRALTLGAKDQRLWTTGATLPLPSDVDSLNWPDLDAVTPKPADADAVLCIDAELLYSLAKALIGRDRDTLMVELHVRLDKTVADGARTSTVGMNVIPSYPVTPGAQGVLMPLKYPKS